MAAGCSHLLAATAAWHWLLPDAAVVTALGDTGLIMWALGLGGSGLEGSMVGDKENKKAPPSCSAVLVVLQWQGEVLCVD